MLLFKNKYRVETTRLQNWNYGWNGKYFVTIVTKNREHFFGKIIHGKMYLSEIGENANKCWKEIPEHFPFVVLDEFCVMPNHIHGIVEIDKKNDGRKNTNVETQNFASLQLTKTPQSKQNQFGPQSKNLGSIIRGFKIGVTKFANKNNYNFAWQSRFHEHIIRNEKSLNRIRNYIRTNPQRWENDKFNLE